MATHALSIFGDHSDVMAARSTGWGMLASGSVQEAHDLALVAHAATLASRVPFLHFFDGFRTSHEVAKIRALTDGDLAAVVDLDGVRAHRERGMSPDRPRLRGSAQNPDVFFQAREAANPFYAATPEIVQATMDRLAERTGRRYRLVDYQGDPGADRVMVLMGSGAGAAAEAVAAMNAAGERVGLVTVRLYRPFPAAALAAALPDSVRRVAVLDRTKEPGATGEPLYQDVVTALAEHAAATGTPPPLVVGGRYGLASKEFTPAMVKAVLDGLSPDRPRNHFTVGIADDVSHTSLAVDSSFQTEDPDGLRAVFYGLGSDGTVSANKTAVKIIGEGTDLFAQGYFVYDSKKSGSVTVSHLRMSARPIRSTYLIEQANFVACHQFGFLERMDVLERAAPGATFLLNSPWPADQVWEHLPVEVQRQMIDKRLEVWVVDAARVAREAGLGHRINTVMQPCFFALAGVLPREEALAAIKRWVERAFSRRGEEVVARNFAAIDHAVAALGRVQMPGTVSGDRHRRAAIPATAQDSETDVSAQRERVVELRRRLAGLDLPEARELEGIADELVRRSVWIIGGDGWAYDIGSAGLDAVLASGENVNVLVLDTEVYSNTGGQASKASPRGAVAKFAARGKQTGKKDLGLLAMAYGNVYVAHVALGASDMQTVKALLEAEAWPGPSLVIAYSTCIAHGFDMAGSMAHQRDAARSGHWPLYRYHPDAERPFQLDSKPPTVPLRRFAETEARFAILSRTDPAEFEKLMTVAEEDARERWRYYEQLATLPRTAPHLPPRPDRSGGGVEEEDVR